MAKKVNLTWDLNSADETSVVLEKTQNDFVDVTEFDLAAGTTTYLDADVVQGQDYKYRVKACNIFGCSAYSNVAEADIPPVIDPIVIDWAQRVTNNGDPTPSQAIQGYVTTWYQTLVTAGVWSKIKWINFMAPGGIITARTPFLVPAASNDPWVDPTGHYNNSAITVNGWQASAETNFNTGFINTGIDPSSIYASTNEASLFAYVNALGDGSEANQCDICCVSGLNGGQHNLFTVDNPSPTGGFYYDNWDPSGGQGNAGVSSPNIAGFYLASRLSPTDLKMYFANSSHAWAQVGSSASSGGVVPQGSNAGPAPGGYMLFGFMGGGGSIFFGSGSRKRYSLMGGGLGLTSADGQVLYNATQTLRQSFGGGFV